jgi:hypothetical protein
MRRLFVVTAAITTVLSTILARRRGLGLLSEVLGPSYVDQDTAARLFLHRGRHGR